MILENKVGKQRNQNEIVPKLSNKIFKTKISFA